MRKKIKTNLDEAVQYLDFELKNDTQNLKKTRRFWFYKIINYNKLKLQYFFHHTLDPFL